MFCLYKYEFKY